VSSPDTGRLAFLFNAADRNAQGKSPHLRTKLSQNLRTCDHTPNRVITNPDILPKSTQKTESPARQQRRNNAHVFLLAKNIPAAGSDTKTPGKA